MCNVGNLQIDTMANLRRFSFNYTRKGNQPSEVFIWKAKSTSVTVNVDFTHEGKKWAVVNT